jgi:hypothetical protein
MDHCWQILGGRPLRRRRELVLVYGWQRLRGPAALQRSGGATAWIIAGRSLEGSLFKAMSVGLKKSPALDDKGLNAPFPSRELFPFGTSPKDGA